MSCDPITLTEVERKKFLSFARQESRINLSEGNRIHQEAGGWLPSESIKLKTQSTAWAIVLAMLGDLSPHEVSER